MVDFPQYYSPQRRIRTSDTIPVHATTGWTLSEILCLVPGRSCSVLRTVAPWVPPILRHWNMEQNEKSSVEERWMTD